MSKSILEVIGPEVTIDGAPWLPKGEKRAVGLNSMTARILCERHNNALSPLDAEAGRFVGRLRAIYDNFERHSLSRSNKAFLVSGEVIELWMLKAACGLFFSKNAARNGVRVIDDHDFDINLVVAAFSAKQWGNRCGMYVRVPVHHLVDASLNIKMAPLIISGGTTIIGSRIWVLGIEFDLIFNPQGVNFDIQIGQGWLYRPSEFQFTFEQRTRSIALTWPPGNPLKSVKMKQRPRPGMKR